MGFWKKNRTAGERQIEADRKRKERSGKKAITAALRKRVLLRWYGFFKNPSEVVPVHWWHWHRRRHMRGNKKKTENLKKRRKIRRREKSPQRDVIGNIDFSIK
ncbi:hypothetical protein L6164_025999 [Bauhinia variegata]|uniref:Uncharacterized protein n=1 Tax=Bauhinia variegata TaxID=167791 RepID=A0ACB9M3V5_BAUVA|nr:hypothetical protein L6164_025999 [Bauhinia variegata]